MTFQPDPKIIRWRMHLKASPEQVYDMLSTNDGRALFWAESAIEMDKNILFIFPDGQKWRGKILEEKEHSLYRVNYTGNSTATFQLEGDGGKGTVLTLTDEGVAAQDRAEVIAGWVTVLMALKAACDFGIDLRNHNTKYSWDKGFADN